VGTGACPPELPLRFAMVLYYLLWNYRKSGDATAAGTSQWRGFNELLIEQVSFNKNEISLPGM